MTPLTRAEIMALTPEQLRLKVAEHIFGIKAFVVGRDDTIFIHREYLRMEECWYWTPDNYQEVLPDYPGDIAAAWTVHSAQKEDSEYSGELYEIVTDRTGCKRILSWIVYVETADICRAALLTESERAS